MFSHFTLGSNDPNRSLAFYSAVLEYVGMHGMQSGSQDGFLMFGPADQGYPHLFISRPYDGLPATWSNGFHIAFRADSREQVKGFHQASLQAGGYDEGAPGDRPH